MHSTEGVGSCDSLRPPGLARRATAAVAAGAGARSTGWQSPWRHNQLPRGGVLARVPCLCHQATRRAAAPGGGRTRGRGCGMASTPSPWQGAPRTGSLRACVQPRRRRRAPPCASQATRSACRAACCACRPPRCRRAPCACSSRPLRSRCRSPGVLAGRAGVRRQGGVPTCAEPGLTGLRFCRPPASTQREREPSGCTGRRSEGAGACLPARGPGRCCRLGLFWRHPKEGAIGRVRAAAATMADAAPAGRRLRRPPPLPVRPAPAAPGACAATPARGEE